MTKLHNWMKTWTVPEALVASVALLCTTALAIVLTLHDDWGKLTRWLASPEALGFVVALSTLIGVAYSRARRLPGTGGAALLLALALGASTLSGCTAAQSAEAFAIAKPALKWSCALANALCIKGNDDVACGIVAAGCGIAEPLLDAVAASSATSGGETTDEPHDLDAEP